MLCGIYNKNPFSEKRKRGFVLRSFNYLSADNYPFRSFVNRKRIAFKYRKVCVKSRRNGTDSVRKSEYLCRNAGNGFYRFIVIHSRSYSNSRRKRKVLDRHFRVIGADSYLNSRLVKYCRVFIPFVRKFRFRPCANKRTYDGSRLFFRKFYIFFVI